MSSCENSRDQIAVTKAPANVPRRSMINLVNLLLRETSHRVTVLQRCDGPDPEIYVVTCVEWRNPDITKSFLPQLPRILSLLETLRASKGVPREVYLDSTEGITVYLPCGLKVSDLPEDSKKAVHLLISIVEDTLEQMYSTMNEVEHWFWKVALQKGLSHEVIEKMDNKELSFDTKELMWRFQRLLQRYFSLRFSIQKSESCLHVED